MSEAARYQGYFKYLVRLEAMLRSVHENFLILRKNASEEIYTEEFRKEIEQLFERSLLRDLFETIERVAPIGIGLRWRLIASILKFLEKIEPREVRESIISIEQNVNNLGGMIAIARLLGLDSEVEALNKDEPRILLYLSGAGGESSESVRAHLLALQEFCDRECLSLNAFVQSSHLETDDEATREFRHFVRISEYRQWLSLRIPLELKSLCAVGLSLPLP